MVCRTRVRAITRLTCAALLTGLAFTAFAQSACTAQAAMQLPGGENFKEMRITDGERMVVLRGKLKSLEDHIELRLIGASEEAENVTVKADKIEFFYDVVPGEMAAGEETTGVAESSVTDEQEKPAENETEAAATASPGTVSFTMESSKRELQADEVTWFTADNRAEFRGNPRVVSEDGTLTGTSIVHYLSEDRTVVQNPRAVFVIPEKEEVEKEGDKKIEGKQ